MEVFTLIGLGGFLLYLAPYALLQLDLLDGNGFWYTMTNVVAAAMVLVSMIEQFNLASAMIQTTWISIGLCGLFYKMVQSSDEADTSYTAAEAYVQSWTAAPPAHSLMQIDWLEHELVLVDRVRRGELSRQELGGVLQDIAGPAAANSVDHVRMMITLLDAAPVLRSTIYAIVLNPHDVDDVVQETLLAVSHSLPSYRAEAPVLGWVNGIARNKAKDLLRRKGRSASPDPHDHIPTEHERFTSQWATHADVDQALATLSPKLRTVFELADIDGLSYVEIASELGIERNTVASRLRRARAQLQLLVAVGATP